MQTITYEGYFNNGNFYTSGKTVCIPEQRRVIITILDDTQTAYEDKITEWNEIKRMISETAHENHLLSSDAFDRDKSSRELIDFADGGSIL